MGHAPSPPSFFSSYHAIFHVARAFSSLAELIGANFPYDRATSSSSPLPPPPPPSPLHLYRHRDGCFVLKLSARPRWIVRIFNYLPHERSRQIYVFLNLEKIFRISLSEDTLRVEDVICRRDHILNGCYNNSTVAVGKIVSDGIIMLTQFYHQRRLLIQFLSVSISFFASFSLSSLRPYSLALEFNYIY